ncbi:MAG: MBOAT family protein [Eubacteriales bacterium]|nr:MBOAT family protein [Eubacteriales bacterium]
MVFSSSIFIFIFLPTVFILNLLLPVKYRNGLLLFASLFFYAWGEPVYVLIMLLSIVVNYFLALLIGKSGQSKTNSILTLTVVFNLLMLIVFKYTNFIVDNINRLINVPIEIPYIALPIGISFFTFQSMSYVIDVYRDKSLMQKNIFNVALYISLFPQLIAGPVVRYHDIASQIESRSENVDKMALGIRRFTIGLAKKLLIANTLGELADRIFSSDMPGLTTSEAWVGAIAYTLQIYFDFSGYSDMAIGLGRLFGFEIMENFNFPFIARSIRDFWRRWHISLTTWFRDYLYIPLGGNRNGTGRTYFNISVVFLLTGLWHGAEWTFLIWGAFHGVFMVLERTGILKPEEIKPKFLGNIYTLIIVVAGFVIFRSESFSQAADFFKAMFAKFSFEIRDPALRADLLSPMMVITFTSAVLASTPIVPFIADKFKGSKRIARTVNATGYILSFALLFLCILALSLNTYNPFIYFRF